MAVGLDTSWNDLKGLYEDAVQKRNFATQATVYKGMQAFVKDHPNYTLPQAKHLSQRKYKKTDALIHEYNKDCCTIL